jgi:hypothetical protein
MIRNRVERIGNIKDVAECRSGGSRDRSHVVGSTGGREHRAMAWGGRVEGAIGNHVTGVISPGRSRSFGYLTGR